MSTQEKVNILLVDDEPSKLLSYEVILAELGENLIRANSGRQALKQLLETDVAVVLLDVCMPDMDGFELAEIIRNHPRCEKTAIILVSAVYFSDFDRLRGYGCGAVDYIPVPIVPELLRARVSVFADLYRKSKQLTQLNAELEQRVDERTAALEASTASLRESEAKFRRTFECSMIPMGVWTRDGTIIEANGALLELLRYSPEDMAAGRLRWYQKGTEYWCEDDERFLREVSAQGVGSPYEKLFMTRDGCGVPTWFGGASFDHRADRGVFFAVDLSERRHVEIERQQLLEREREARAAAEQANRVKDEFLATLSHELRTPINAVLGWTQLLMSGRLDENTRAEGLRAIERGVRTQVRLIDELLDVNRISSGKFKIEREPVELAGVIRAAIETVLPDAAEKDIKLQLEGDTRGVMVFGDATRLQQVFWNLLANAVRFTPSKGRITVEIQRGDQQTHVLVRDNGQGINPEFLPQLFQRFRQADSSTTRQHGGLGLGLAIVKHILELHGATISAESDGDGCGATFTVCIPNLGRDAKVCETVAESDGELQRENLSGLRVLIVDDDFAARDIVSRILRECGSLTLTAADCDEALRLYLESRPDLVICDIGMPQKDGYALIGELNALSPESGTPSVALTAYTRPEDRRRALASGFSAHLPKPVNPRDLLQTVARLAADLTEAS